MTTVALLSNPRATGNKSHLPQVRCYCAENPDIFHYEVEDIDQISRALETIARVRPKVLVINGGDGTVQAALTEIYHGGHFAGAAPPVAVLPNGKTNLIAYDLGAQGSPIAALKRIVEIARTDLEKHIVVRELIALSDGGENSRAVLGMFLGGAGLADIILYCRHKIYPLGLPNGISHFLAALATIGSVLLGITARFLPPRPSAVRVSFLRRGELHGSFVLLIVTTLEKLLLGSHSGSADMEGGRLKFLAVERSGRAVIQTALDGLFGRFGTRRSKGIHLERGDMIRIESDRSKVLLDGELFEASAEKPIVLKSTEPVSFLRLAA